MEESSNKISGNPENVKLVDLPSDENKVFWPTNDKR